MSDDAAYLAADADDARAALAFTAEVVARRGDTDIEHGQGRGPHWQQIADQAYSWLRNRVSLRASAITLVPGTPEKEGTTVTATIDLSDIDQVTFTLSAEDAKGASVPVPADTWTWDLADPDSTGSVLTVSTDTLSATVAAGTPDTTGTLTLTVTGQTSGLTGAEAILVVASAASVIGLVAGTPAPE